MSHRLLGRKCGWLSISGCVRLLRRGSIPLKLKGSGMEVTIYMAKDRERYQAAVVGAVRKVGNAKRFPRRRPPPSFPQPTNSAIQPSHLSAMAAWVRDCRSVSGNEERMTLSGIHNVGAIRFRTVLAQRRNPHDGLTIREADTRPRRTCKAYPSRRSRSLAVSSLAQPPWIS
jgi:hypothetical protein